MPRHSTRRSRLSLAVTAVVLLAGSTAGGAYLVDRASEAAPAAGAAVSSAPGASEEPEVDLDAELAAAVAPPAGDADVSVAVRAVDGGADAVYGDGRYDTASIVKVDILAALLLRAQDEGRQLDDAELAYADAMIRRSDNTSATELLTAVGGAEGLDTANERLGLRETDAVHAWGLTQTTAADQVRLLEAVFGTDSALTAASRSYLAELMGRVEADQQWGVSAAGTAWALKNGWLRRTTTGLWDVNSIGRVTSGGRSYLVAVVSRGHATWEEGIALVESVAKAAVDAVATASGEGRTSTG
ncbi:MULTISPECIES: serine hydrolase [Streptomyces]|uniref:serine hydrolase n=1 Tax=Streptomyces TaxID=1883 RepID=UPI00081E6382|nr:MULTISPECIES: serine hydrolase [Streptomyces]MCW8220911.1 serine hydrolase [Streptomyces griseolus]SCD71344.1 Beta-lactamase class A [Streptomyces sp. PpalLS-921]